MQSWGDAVLNKRGEPMVGLSVTVLTDPGGVAATLYSDNGVTLIVGNVLTTNSDGEYLFFASDGRYKVVISGLNITTKTRRGIVLDDSVATFSNTYSSASMTYNATPNTGLNLQIMLGDNVVSYNDAANATKANAYFQRVEESVTADNAANLIYNLYAVSKKKPTARGWLTTIYGYIEDQSNSLTSQSVGMAGVAHSTDKASVWGLYGEAHARGANSTATGAELDAFSYVADFTYNAADPFAIAHAKALWLFAAGPKKSTLALGIGSQSRYTAAQTVAESWRVGVYMQTWSITDIGIDIQAQPQTLINFKYGASTDGTGVTPGGIGIDCGAGSSFGTAVHQGAIHLRNHRLVYGSAGLGFMAFNTADGRLEFVYNGNVVGYIDAAYANARMNGSPLATYTAAGTLAITQFDAVDEVIFSAACTVTLPAAATNVGRRIWMLNNSISAIISASANIVQLDAVTATAALLPATKGRWCCIMSNGATWTIVAANTGNSQTPVATSAATLTIGTDDDVESVIFGAACTVTLPAAANSIGREIWLVTTGANAIISNAANVVPIVGGAAGTAILAAVAGRWARIKCNGTNWNIIAAN